MGAIISQCGTYRYVLTRDTNLLTRERPDALFIMLNPSTADAAQNDPTIRRCISFASQWGCDGLTVVNLYAYRATSPAKLLETPDPVGPLNDFHLKEQLRERHDVVCAWGNHAQLSRVSEFYKMAQEIGVRLMCLGVTKAGHPRHPLYVRSSQELVRWK